MPFFNQTVNLNAMDILVQQVTKFYGPQKALDNISFTVKTGEILGFLGPNGAGKSTTMRAITGYLAPNSGEISIGGISVTENPDAVKPHIGYLPETNPLYLEMGVIDYLRFTAEIHRIPHDKIRTRIAEIIGICGLKGEKHKKIGELSKGYRQRVGLAQALIHDPDVLIMDEPTVGLDPNQIVEIRDLIRQIGQQKTVILSSHILAEVEATCNRILIINKGRIVADGTAQNLRQRAYNRELIRVSVENASPDEVFQALKTLETVARVDKVSGSDDNFEIQSKEGMSSKRSIFSLCVQKQWYLGQLTPVETRLEDVFRELTMN
jgi:ABC-2 type transport system ATP-binding protein